MSSEIKHMSRDTGGSLDTEAHIIQSVKDILTTPIGTRLMRRDYGSNLLSLVDAPMNRALPILMSNAVATALTLWEKRLLLKRVVIEASQTDQYASGSMTISLDAVRIDTPKPTPFSLSISI